MSYRPTPPNAFDSFDSFRDHVTAHPEAWFEYFKRLNTYAESVDAKALALQKAHRVEALTPETTCDGTLAMQKQLKEAKDQVFEARYNERKALDMVRLAARLDTAPPAGPTHLTRLSEPLPDPVMFEGDRQDLTRFVSQIREKLKANHDRFPTPQSRISYVNLRLKRKPYAQIMPYIQLKDCQLSDYEDILTILDRVYGDPDQRSHARTQLFRLRQANRDFATFFAEFRDLAAEADLSESALAAMLEQCISKELRALLILNDPPSRKYHDLAFFLQNLENTSNITRNICRRFPHKIGPLS